MAHHEDLHAVVVGRADHGDGAAGLEAGGVRVRDTRQRGDVRAAGERLA
jgi:hypothetical protein